MFLVLFKVVPPLRKVSYLESSNSLKNASIHPKIGWQLKQDLVNKKIFFKISAACRPISEHKWAEKHT